MDAFRYPKSGSSHPVVAVGFLAALAATAVDPVNPRVSAVVFGFAAVILVASTYLVVFRETRLIVDDSGLHGVYRGKTCFVPMSHVVDVSCRWGVTTVRLYDGSKLRLPGLAKRDAGLLSACLGDVAVVNRFLVR